jgi:hypothetical protein
MSTTINLDLANQPTQPDLSAAGPTSNASPPTKEESPRPRPKTLRDVLGLLRSVGPWNRLDGLSKATKRGIALSSLFAICVALPPVLSSTGMLARSLPVRPTPSLLPGNPMPMPTTSRTPVHAPSMNPSATVPASPLSPNPSPLGMPIDLPAEWSAVPKGAAGVPTQPTAKALPKTGTQPPFHLANTTTGRGPQSTKGEQAKPEPKPEPRKKLVHKAKIVPPSEIRNNQTAKVAAARLAAAQLSP